MHETSDEELHEPFDEEIDKLSNEELDELSYLLHELSSSSHSLYKLSWSLSSSSISTDSLDNDDMDYKPFKKQAKLHAETLSVE